MVCNEDEKGCEIKTVKYDLSEPGESIGIGFPGFCMISLFSQSMDGYLAGGSG